MRFLQSATHDTYVFQRQRIGASQSDRVVVVFVASYYGSVQRQVSSITVAGRSGTEAIASYRTGDPNYVLGDAAIWSFAVPAAITEADISVQFSQSTGGCSITVYALYGTTAAAAVAGRAYHRDAESVRPTVTIDAPAGGICIGGQLSTNIPLTGIAWTGLAEQDQMVDDQGHTWTTAMTSFTDAVTGLVVSTANSPNYRCYRTLLVACWAPAVE